MPVSYPTPVPDEVAAFDRLLESANDHIAAETAVLRERNRRLEGLLAEKKMLLESLEATWKTAQSRRKRIDAEIARLTQTV